ncbi:MAG TPA: hypothetical protein VKS22_15110 [Candidatus Binataceae bacterium]|nr:hypothetical protein [Candidatus Binataceae bacterium]
MFEPWKGNHYCATRLLLLGESCYSWEKNGQHKDPTQNHSIDIIEGVIYNFAGGSHFSKCLSRALCAEHDPSPKRLEYCWDRVAFTNYVPIALSGVNDRPKPEMWQQAKQEFSQVLNLLEPKRIIVFGRTMWANMPDNTVDCFDREGDVQTYRLSSGELCYCRAVDHPRAGLGWQTLAGIIHFACGDAFTEPK